MTGKQLIAMVLGIAVIYYGSSSYSAYLDSQEKMVAENNRYQLEMALIK